MTSIHAAELAAVQAAATLGGAARELLDAVTVPTYVHRAGTVLHANPSMLRLAGHALPELCTMHHSALATAAERDSLCRYGESCLANAQDPPAMELQLANAQGGVRPVEINARRLVLDGLPSVVVTCQDLSDIQHVQSSMLNLSQLLHQIINGGPLATFVVDKEQRITHWNRACEQLTGWSPGDMLGSTEKWRAFYPQERPVLADLIVAGVPHDRLLELFDNEISRADLVDGAYEGEAFVPGLGTGGRWLHFNAAPLRDASGEIIGAVQTMQDVTERREAEQELLRHRNQLEQLVEERSTELRATVAQLAAFMDNSPVGIVHMVDGTVGHHNRVLADMFGLAGHSLIGRRGADFFLDRGDYSQLMQLAIPRLEQGLPVHHEMWMRHHSGSSLWVQIIAYAADTRDLGAGTWWLVQDRTDFRRTQDELHANLARIRETNQKLEDAQNQLLQQDKMASIGQLAAGVAHEINNPIGFVSSNLHTLKSYAADMMRLIDAYQGAAAAGADGALQTALARTRKSVDIDYLREDVPLLLRESEEGLGRVKRIVQDLKDFSRVDQSEWQEADLNAGMESTLNVVMNEVKYKATIVRALQPLPLVRCLAAQLNQVFMNLVVNASQAMTSPGTITLSSGVVGDWAWMEVADTGCGMSDEVRKRVFEPFYTTKAVGKGTGLGLSLSFSIVQRHGGAIRIRSAPGAGSAFKVWVPIAGPAADGNNPAPPVDY
jgi:two-component system, NtrC family, sensor kinase